MSKANTHDLIARLRRQPEDIDGPARMDMLRERGEAADMLEHLREQIERAAIACSQGGTQIARDILLEALG